LFSLTEAHDAEHDCQDDESHQLDWLATDRVDCSDGDPVTGNGTGADEDEVTDGDVVEDFVNTVALCVTDG
jgi:hypothetical protein